MTLRIMTYNLRDGELLSQGLAAILQPSSLFTPLRIINDLRCVPSEPGVYGWWFDAVPKGIPFDRAPEFNGRRLLYVGIAPHRPSGSGKVSKSNLRRRLRQHCKGPIRTSTLRRSLAAVLQSHLDLKVVRTHSQKLTMPLSDEIRLTKWLEESAAVCWHTSPSPWEIEHKLIHNASFLIPLNILGNRHAFRSELKSLRKRLGASSPN